MGVLEYFITAKSIYILAHQETLLPLRQQQHTEVGVATVLKPGARRLKIVPIHVSPPSLFGTKTSATLLELYQTRLNSLV